jgi:hypothetical protein
MNLVALGCAAVLAGACAVLVAVYAAVVAGSRADDQMEQYMASRWDDEDPPTGI